MNNTISPEMLNLIRTNPGTTRDGKPFDWIVKQKVQSGEWRLEQIPADIVGLKRPIEIYRAVRKSNFIKPWINKAQKDSAYCSEYWADLAIGWGACGFRCRGCFLNLTARGFVNPARHVVYENVDDYKDAVLKWLKNPDRKNLGLGIDSSDSLLYEAITGHAQRLIPVFADPVINPHQCELILLTKSKNIHHLKGLPTTNIVITFSLNPEPVADLFEGKWNDGVRITPSIADRLQAFQLVREMGFESRWRVDPILLVDNWREIYKKFFEDVALQGLLPTRITLGIYREMGRGLLTMGQKWGLPPLEWQPPKMTKQGLHYHIPVQDRITVYGFIKQAIEEAWRRTGHTPIVALCKETTAVREAVGITHSHCNCE